MQRDIDIKWRPPMWLVIACTISGMLLLPILALFVLSRLVLVMDFNSALLITAVGAVAIGIIIGWVLLRILLRPITTLAARADEIRMGEADALAPLAHYGTSEMEAMGRAIRQMGKSLQDREAILRNYADHVTHELKSPLTVIQGASELLADPDLPEAHRTRMVANVADASDRMKALLDAQRALAIANELLAEGTCWLSDVLPQADDVIIARDGEIPISKAVFEPVATHLINNARSHGATKIEFSLDNSALKIADDGAGISQGNRDRVFDPFFTTRRNSGGTGMGLSIVRRMLETQGASISLAPGDVTVFIIEF